VLIRGKSVFRKNGGVSRYFSIDDREKTPNFGKQIVSLGTVIVTPPIIVLGVRGYSKEHYGRHAEFDDLMFILKTFQKRFRNIYL